MANEISYSAALTVRNGDLYDSYNSQTQQATQSNARLVRNTQSISNAAHSALALGGVTAPGFAIFTNLSDTYYIEVGVDSGGFVPFLKLLPGECSGPVRLATAAPYAKANTAPAYLFYIIYDT